MPAVDPAYGQWLNADARGSKMARVLDGANVANPPEPKPEWVPVAEQPEEPVAADG